MRSLLSKVLEVRLAARGWPVILLLFASALIGSFEGCDDGALGERSESCSVYCEKLEVCDDGTDVAGCEQHCMQQVVRSDAYLRARARCAEARSCNTFAREIGSMGEDLCGTGDECTLNDCTSDDLARRPPSAIESSYCASITSKLKACDGTIESAVLERHCIELVPTLADDYLELAQSCIQGDCTQVKQCLRSAADRFNTELTPGPEQWLRKD
jgi:hypothetical protein